MDWVKADPFTKSIRLDQDRPIKYFWVRTFVVDLANGLIGSGTGRVVVPFGSIIFGSGLGSGRVKFGFGSLSGQSCSGRVRVRFGWSLGQVCFGLCTVARFGSGMVRV